MTALDWAEENEHQDIAEFLSAAMNTVAVSAAVEKEENAFDEANPIDEVH